MNELESVGKFFVKEQEWVPPFRAPMFLYLGTTLSLAASALGLFLIYQYDKTSRQEELLGEYEEE